jgi:hypothetical protein
MHKKRPKTKKIIKTGQKSGAGCINNNEFGKTDLKLTIKNKEKSNEKKEKEK